MIGKIWSLKTNLINRLIGVFILLLMATLVAEMTTILIIDKGIDITSLFSLKLITVRGSAFCEWIWRMVGPMVFPFMALAGVLSWSLKKLIWYWRFQPEGYDPENIYKMLYIVEIVAPAFGFWGTCQALMTTMQNIDPSQAQKALLTALLSSSSMAFVTTILGLAFSILAFLSREIFKDFLIQSSTNEKSPSSVIDVQATLASDRVFIKKSKTKGDKAQTIDAIANREKRLCADS